MPRAKRPSDELYNARRRAKRLAARLEQAGRMGEASVLRTQIAASYGKSASVGASELQASMTGLGNQTVSEHRPRAKRPSDELYNARRRLRRQAERVEREAAKERGKARDLAEGFARYLRQQAEAGKRLDARQRAQEIERLGRIREVTHGADRDDFRIRRRNVILMQQLNAAGTEGADSSINERKKDVFWAATKGLWPRGSNVPRNERYDRILDHFYTDNTTDAREFREWLEKSKGTNAKDSYGDLQLVFEYITEELNDPMVYEMPEIPYQDVMDLIRTAM